MLIDLEHTVLLFRFTDAALLYLAIVPPLHLCPVLLALTSSSQWGWGLGGRYHHLSTGPPACQLDFSSCSRVQFGLHRH